MNFIKKNKALLVSAIVFAFLGLFIAGNFAYAVDLNTSLKGAGTGIYGDEAKIPAKDSLPKIIGKVIGVVLSIVGVILVIIVIYSGFLWMTAGGNDDQVKKAKSWLTNAVIGLIIALAAYSITSFVIDRIGGAVLGDSAAPAAPANP